MKYHYSVDAGETVYNGFFKFNRYTVSFETFDGDILHNIYRECGKKGDIVAVIPYDPVRQEVLLIEQFRIGMVVRGVHPWNLEIVAGFMDVAGEDEATTAKRELNEETGCQATALHPLIAYYPSPGGSASRVHIFIAEVDASQALPHTGIKAEGEDIRVHRLSLAELREKVANNDIDNATAIIAFQQFFIGGWPEKLTAAQAP
ncbi:MAG: ADP-ribose pyrophosphatase [Gammaproteobacteria bacterium]|nr:MAG: ADP-ribose pyrophosphatase [Gammaproteobacteria bacterium]